MMSYYIFKYTPEYSGVNRVDLIWEDFESVQIMRQGERQRPAPYGNFGPGPR